MTLQISNVLSNEVIDYILSCPEVMEAKTRIQAKGIGSEYFSLPLTPSIRSELFEHFDIEFPQTSIPMRWISGDIPSHHDNSVASFENTYLVYLTDSNGKLMIDGITYPIQRGYGYVFAEGLSHETIGTNTDAEPRLLLGPMSEAGIAVGASSYIQFPGGTTVYLKQTDVGEPIIFSTDMLTWNPIYWPISVNNSDTSQGILNIEFINDITMDTNVYGSGYFICTSENIQFGSRTAKNDGKRPVITIADIENYPGLIQNGTNWSNGYDNVYVMNLVISATGTYTLAQGGGWFGQEYFGKGTTNQSNMILNCYSSGNITRTSGGISGQYSGPIKCINCSSSGDIYEERGGGIVGGDSPTSGTLICDSCWSTGSIGSYGGGITGQSTRSANITNCYSTGEIGSYAGGISGIYSGYINDCYISACYSTGYIRVGGGGISGSESYVVHISNCYSTGNIEADAGGILGIVSNGGNNTPKYISNCYATGSIGTNYGYIVQNFAAENGNITIHTGTLYLSNNYSEAKHLNSVWVNSRANTILQGVPTSSVIGDKWVYAGPNVPYELTNMGFTPYPQTTISTAPFSMIKTFVSTVYTGHSTAPTIIGGLNYSKLRITGGYEPSYGGITINRETGIISTSRFTLPGTYVIMIRNNVYNQVGYNISAYVLTVVPYVHIRNLFTNNAQVYYKPHSLASCGVGTVRNSRQKSRKT